MKLRLFSAAVCLAAGAQSVVTYAAREGSAESSAENKVGGGVQGVARSLAAEVSGISAAVAGGSGHTDVDLRSLNEKVQKIALPREGGSGRNAIKGGKKGTVRGILSFLSSRRFRSIKSKVSYLIFWGCLTLASWRAAGLYLEKNYLQVLR